MVIFRKERKRKTAQTKNSQGFLFLMRNGKEPPQRYWERVIVKNLKRGVSPETVARVVGKILGDKEEREGIDGLTGLKTKLVFWQDLKEVLGHTRRRFRNGAPEPVALILLDIDNFKKLNDTKGYLWGDKILQEVAKVLKKERRAEDVVSRFGGEEFCLILPACFPKEAMRIAEKLKEKIRKVGITASFGVVVSLDGQEKPEKFFEKANVACAIAKGRLDHSSVGGPPKDRVVLWQPDMPVRLEKTNA